MENPSTTDRDANKQRPHWSVVSCFWVAIVILVVATAAVLLLMKKPVWVELETLAVLAGLVMTVFYTYLLYKGVRFLDNETISLKSLIGSPVDFIEGVGHGIDFGTFTAAGASDGPFGCLFGLILDVIVCLLLAFVLGLLLWLGVNLVFVSIVMVAIPFFYIFQRSLLFVMKHANECHGNFWISLRYGFFYAAVKTAVLCAIVFASHQLVFYVNEHLLN